MEVASRPSLEPLPDLPVEAPLEPSGASTKAPAVTPAASATAAAAAATGSAPAKSIESTGITFLDPDSLVLEGAAGSETPPVLAAAPAAPAAQSEVELTLEDPIVDELLTAPPPPPAPPPVKSAPAAAPVPAATPDRARTEARVPIAKTASLSSAATKLAAANRRTNEGTAKAAPTVRPAPAATSAPAAPVTAPAAPAAPAVAQAQSLADWTNARAAAAASAKKPQGDGTPAAAPAKPAPAPRPSAPKPAAPATVSAPPAPAPATVSAPPAATVNPAANALPPSPPIDRDFIARNQVVERYLSGRLPLKGATEFEQYCGRHPELLDEIGLPERVNAGLRLLEASGKPEPWQEAPRPAWQRPQVTIALAVIALICGSVAAVLAGASASRAHRIEQLQKQLVEQPLDPATSTREIRLLPSREGASNSPAITIGGATTQMADLKIDESRSAYHIFRITIDRIDQGRVGVITNLVKDSNGHLRIALNSSALGPGNYQMTIEGIDWRGDPQPDSWITIGVAR
ncbi:MAG: hypothetical protein JSR36_18465 [Proteobacteria bacterium]|nr:hypothetical protein [Pseudomonadota bacterium]